MKYTTLVATLVAIVTLSGAASVSAQQKHPEKVVKQTETKVKPAIPLKSAPVVVKDSTEKKAIDRKVKKIVPKAKPSGK
ncbi:hypothetical protein ACFX5U_01435 [Sphingobacterium sp. SG20118]|uniref:hypothetical protein n=1 Tax=Sphingobacterium TaxID=28453 RepID=UPI0004F808B5|nr:MULTISPECIES: hypothetical protein [Sphingobacterium]AIM35747.1 hypothetical protein KO02_02945 [Sphingobacterium sp. ML3W]MDH5828126.1 hypothetical protein [Sphingobacterium faecium]